MKKETEALIAMLSNPDKQPEAIVLISDYINKIEVDVDTIPVLNTKINELRDTNSKLALRATMTAPIVEPEPELTGDEYFNNVFLAKALKEENNG